MIRHAIAADAALLARLHTEAFPEPWDAPAFADLLASTGVLGLVSDHGFILIRTVAGEAEILTLAVSPGARRRGQGQALVEAGADAARQAGAATMFLEVAADNAAALALYARAGFEPVGRRPRYYQRPVGPAMDALILRKTLTAPGA